jgi:ABC-2 type transport system ATP-binding protein
VRDLVLTLRDSGTTVFLNSHLLSEVELTCSRVGILNDGKLVRVSDLKSLAEPGHTVEIRALGINDETMSRIKSLAKRVEPNDGYLLVTVEEEATLSELARIIIDSGASLTEFNPRQVPLEEAFMRIIEESDAASGRIGDETS